MGDITSLDAATVAAWLRAQARKFDEMASNVEAAFGSKNGNVAVPLPVLPDDGSSAQRPKVSERIREFIQNEPRAKRPAEIAAELEISEGLVRRVLDKRRDLFNVNERGWVTLKD